MKLGLATASILALNWLVSAQAWAQAAAAGAAPAAARPGFQDMIIPVVGFIFVFYIIVLRPQQKKIKEQQSFLSALKRGDQVITNGGILGEITNITEKVVTLQVADDVRIKVVRSQIMGLAKEGIS